MTIAAALAFLIATAASPAPSYDRLVRTARAHLEMGSVERAHELASSAATAAPERPEAHAILGSIFASRNELDEAIAAYERARARKSRDRRLFLELTSVYDITRRYDDAVVVYRAWLEENPDDAEFLKELGLTLLIQNKPKEAVVSLRRAAKARPEDLELQRKQIVGGPTTPTARRS